jgi:hypothetical protein
MTLEEYWCTVSLVFGLILMVAVIIMQAVFHSTWAETGADYYVAYNYIYICCYVFVIMLNLDSQFMMVC